MTRNQTNNRCVDCWHFGLNKTPILFAGCYAFYRMRPTIDSFDFKYCELFELADEIDSSYLKYYDKKTSNEQSANIKDIKAIETNNI